MNIKLRSTISAVVVLTALLSAAALTPAAAEPPVSQLEEPAADAINARTRDVLKAGRSTDVIISVHFNTAVIDPLLYDGSALIRVTGFSPAELYTGSNDLLLHRPIASISAAGWAEITYPVTLHSLFTGASVSLTVEISYESDARRDFVQTVSLPVDNRQPEITIPPPDPDPIPTPNPTVASITVAPRTVTIRAGQTSRISVEVVNSGERAANNLSATLTPVGQDLMRLLNANPPSAFTATINAVRRAGSANTGNRGTFTYNIIAPDTLRSGVYEFRVSGSFYHESTNNLGVFEGSVQVVVVNDFEPVSMQIVDVGPLYPIHSGELFNVNVQVLNTGGLTAREVVVSVRNTSDTTFTVMGSAAAGMIGTVGAGQSGNRTITLRAAQTMQPGFYPLVIQLGYLDAEDQPQTTEFDTFVEILSVPDVPEAEIELVRATVPGGTLSPGQRAVMTLELRNSSAADAENVRVRVSGFSGAGLYLVDAEDNMPTKTIETLAAGERALVTYNVILSDVCNTPSLALQAEITHTLTDGSSATVTENISFAVLLPTPTTIEPPSPEPPNSVPKLIIDSYRLSWEDQTIQSLRAGAMFDLTFTLRNTSSVTALSNITVTLSSVDGIFLPAAGSNTFYIESVEAGGEVERTIRLVVAQNAETKSYPLTFSLDYEDENRVSYRPSESLSLPVVVPLIVELANFNPPMWGDAGMQTYMMFQYINKGKGTVYNFTIEIEGEFMLPDGASTYVGNLASGYTDYFECMMIPLMPGELHGAVVLRFEDAVGNITEMRNEFVMNVNEPFFPEFPGGEFPGMEIWGPEDEQGGGGWFGLPWWIIIAGGCGILAVAAVIIVLARRSKIKKRKFLEDDDLDDDG